MSVNLSTSSLYLEISVKPFFGNNTPLAEALGEPYVKHSLTIFHTNCCTQSFSRQRYSESMTKKCQIFILNLWARYI